MNEQQEYTIHDFIKEHGLSMTTTRLPANPNLDADEKWEGLHFHCVIENARGEVFMTHYSVGKGIAWNWGRENKPKLGYLSMQIGPVSHKDIDNALSFHARRTLVVDEIRRIIEKKYPGPELADVLDCLASDSSSIERARHFEDWCGEYGYDPDSRKAERTYNVCKEQYYQLEKFLGRAALQKLMFEVERM